MKLNSNQIDDYESLEEYKQLASISSINNELYYLHPEAISEANEIHECHLCRICYDSIKSNRLPVYSVANGHDYGDISRLHNVEALTYVEQYAITRYRTYGSIMKIKPTGSIESRQLTGHIITFPQDGPDRTAEVFTFPDIKGTLESLKVVFVGTKGEFEKNRNDCIISCHELQMRTKNVYNWLRMLKKCHPLYYNIVIDESEEMKKSMNELTKTLINETEVIDSDNAINIEKIISSDTAEVRKLPEEVKSCNSSSSIPDISFGYSMIYNNEDSNKELLLKEQALKSVAKTLFPNVIKIARVPGAPVNEYEDNDKLYLGGFPYLFLFGRLGRGVKTRGTLLPNS